ncbi:transcriptional regulator PpsR [Ideonella alba]|uniref:transcriptional regulator PpsR n=1 Tax=Ideonella alba TaxID=2824118 RepID=UPI00287338A3|nr:transcriptional regulator PpsR [Ideonella alba]
MSTRRPLTRAGKATRHLAAVGQTFDQPERTLQALAPGDAASLIWTASDIALIVDPKGVVEDVSTSVNGLPSDVPGGWVGRPWVDVVTPESRTKVESLLSETGNPQWRHVNHPLGQGGDFPVMYRAMPVGQQGRVLALGRDMRSLAKLQQRLVDAQHAVERDYLRLRNVEARYRLLFERATDAILIVDASDLRVLEANPMAIELLGPSSRRLVGQPLGTGLPDRVVRELDALLDRVRSSGRSEEHRLRVTTPRRLDVVVSASLFTQDERTMILVRMRPLQAGGVEGARELGLSQLVQGLPDGFVVTSPDGRVLMANKAFVELAQMTREEHLIGESIERWLGRPGVDLNVMLAALRQQGTLRLFNTVVHGELGVEADVEISAVAAPEAEPPCVAFNIRHVGRRLGQEDTSAKGMPRSVEQLTQLVGRMPLRDLVRESTDLIEQLCIEAALQLTQGNRASAAEMLGLSRQSLYVKLRRYGMAEGSADQAAR